jgi:hypothetical protein
LYRKLAKIHHPDKHKGNDKSKHEDIFRQVATAYETLSDHNKRHEYDASLRYSSTHQQDSYESDYNNYHQRNQQDSYESDFNNYHQRNPQEYYNYQHDFSFDDAFEQFFEFMHTQQPSNGFSPEFTGPFLPAEAIILPYSPIMTSQDRSHFALLDISCSIVVLKGSVEDYLYHNLWSSGHSSSSTPPSVVEEIYRTPEASRLNGQCFAGLNRGGVLQIFAGRPDYPNYHPIWSSEISQELSSFHMHYRRFYIELTNSGEFAVKMLVAGDSDETCVWSTVSCNPYVSRLKTIQRTFASYLRELFHTSSSEQSFFNRLKTILSKIKIINMIVSLVEYIQSKANQLLDSIFPDSDSTETRKRDNNHSGGSRNSFY